MREKSFHPLGFWEECCRCKSQMWLPNSLYDAARSARGKISFFCAYGHSQVYVEGEPEEAKLRRERDRLAQQIAQRDEEISGLRKSWNEAEKRAVTKHRKIISMTKRAKAGVCPCCNRTFIALQRHMNAKHPAFKAEEIAA